MNQPKLFRRRFIPDELVELKNDVILRMDENVIVTEWTALKPRKDFTHGQSVFLTQKGWKISRFLDAREKCLYTYCDIIEICRDDRENTILFNDLLVDVIVYEDGFVKVMDTGELADALAQRLISVDTAIKALRLLDDLLQVIYAGRLPELLEYLPERRVSLAL
ncbi:MAG: DUF402 domain-containing protein [Clostridiales bacterium]|jgi:predicted RNA-binding protein associated with RNAse of E/G family|nr:DUF402 domain-containing protein [Clostridiales bacterium]